MAEFSGAGNIILDNPYPFRLSFFLTSCTIAPAVWRASGYPNWVAFFVAWDCRRFPKKSPECRLCRIQIDFIILGLNGGTQGEEQT